MPTNSTTSWWLFPPKTREIQFDEKWSLIANKQDHCDPNDSNLGDYWDHLAYDPENRLVLCVESGARVGESVESVVQDAKRRTQGRPISLITSNEHRPYPTRRRSSGLTASRRPPRRAANERGRHKWSPRHVCATR